MAVGINELKKGVFIVIDGAPYAVLSASHSHIGRGGALVQTKIKNLMTGNILDRNFRAGDAVEVAEIRKMQAQFLYERRGDYWFCEAGKPANRFALSGNALGDRAALLKPKMEIVALKYVKDKGASPDTGRPWEQIINVELPVKADYRVTHAPPGIRGNTSQGGTKTVTLEGGLKVTVPLFIEEGDTVRINTETREYAERV